MTEPFIGEIGLFSFARIPQGWLPCNGQALSITQYQALFALLSFTFGGDGAKTFRLPDLRSRAIMGFGQSKSGTPYTVGSYGGVENVTLTNSQMPAHSHTLVADQTPATSSQPGQNYFASPTNSAPPTQPLLYAPVVTTSTLVPLNPASVSTVGGNMPHTNIQPALAMSYCIATQGIWPSQP